MKIIKSSNGQDIQVNDCYYEYLSQFTWSITGAGYAWSRMGLGRGSICMHKWIAEQEGLDTSNQIDHKDRNKLNNQASNLRPATQSQNMANRSKWSGCSSDYKGVTWHKHNSKWYAQLMVNRKYVLAKYFKDEVEAAKAYDKAAFEHYGEFATLNFPEDYQ